MEGRGGKILKVGAIPVGDELEVFTEFRNNGNRRCDYMTVLYGKEGEEVKSSPFRSVEAEGIETLEVRTGLSNPKLKGEYTVKLYIAIRLPSGEPIRVKEVAKEGPWEI